MPNDFPQPTAASIFTRSPSGCGTSPGSLSRSPRRGACSSPAGAFCVSNLPPKSRRFSSRYTTSTAFRSCRCSARSSPVIARPTPILWKASAASLGRASSRTLSRAQGSIGCDFATLRGASLRSIRPGASDALRPGFGLLRSARNLARLMRIGVTLARHDALFPLDALPAAAPFLRIGRVLARRATPAAPRPGQRLAAAFGELGPSFIKLGQLLSTRADLFGEEITLDLASLQDRLPPFPGREARALIEAEFGRPLETLFASFDDTAVAAASIAQVHFARTTDGHDVAVKVLRPGIIEAFSRDLDLFLWLASLSERLQPMLRRLKPVEVVQILADVVRF